MVSLWTAFGSAVGRVVISKSSIAIDDGLFARFNLIQRCSRPLPAVGQNGFDGSNGQNGQDLFGGGKNAAGVH